MLLLEANPEYLPKVNTISLRVKCITGAGCYSKFAVPSNLGHKAIFNDVLNWSLLTRFDSIDTRSRLNFRFILIHNLNGLGKIEIY